MATKHFQAISRFFLPAYTFAAKKPCPLGQGWRIKHLIHLPSEILAFCARMAAQVFHFNKPQGFKPSGDSFRKNTGENLIYIAQVIFQVKYLIQIIAGEIFSQEPILQ